MYKTKTVEALNNLIKNGTFNELITEQEAIHEREIAKIAKMIFEEKKRIVLIAGPSSSGKTTFSHRLALRLKAFGIKAHPIAMDDYFLNRDNTPLDEYGEHDFECLEAVDVCQLNEDMNKLLAGGKVSLPTYNFVTGKREYDEHKRLQIDGNDVLLIEGIHCLNEKLTYALPREDKFKIYICPMTSLKINGEDRIPTTDGRLLRRMVRDARTRGVDAKATIARWPSVRRGEEKYIIPYREEADVMFDSSLLYEIAVLKEPAVVALCTISEEEREYAQAKELLGLLKFVCEAESNGVPGSSILKEFIG